MQREEFITKVKEIKSPESLAAQKKHIKDNARGVDEDVSICIGELSELILELTRYQRNKMDYWDVLQELSHVQWAVYRLQGIFGIQDEDIRKGIQASFR